MDRLLWYLFAGSRGGPTRIRIMRALMDEPRNLHQLAKSLGLDYKTVEYQVRVLRKHVLLVSPDPKAYGALHFPSKDFLAARVAFEDIAERAERKRAKASPPRPVSDEPDTQTSPP